MGLEGFFQSPLFHEKDRIVMMSYLMSDVTFVSDPFYTVLFKGFVLFWFFFPTFWYHTEREKPKHYISKEGEK